MANNQTASPLFIDPAAGNFHEAAGSPTIDAGINDPANGTNDIDGDPRQLGPLTDIGADERLPDVPPPTGSSPPPSAKKKCKKHKHRAAAAKKKCKKKRKK